MYSLLSHTLKSLAGHKLFTFIVQSFVVTEIEVVNISTSANSLVNLDFLCSSDGLISVLKLFSNLLIPFYLFFILTKAVQSTRKNVKYRYNTIFSIYALKPEDIGHKYNNAYQSESDLLS